MSPWDDLKDVEALHTYLRANGRGSDIPKSHQTLMDRKPSVPKKDKSADATSPKVLEKSPKKRKLRQDP